MKQAIYVSSDISSGGGLPAYPPLHLSSLILSTFSSSYHSIHHTRVCKYNEKEVEGLTSARTFDFWLGAEGKIPVPYRFPRSNEALALAAEAMFQY